MPKILQKLLGILKSKPWGETAERALLIAALRDPTQAPLAAEVLRETLRSPRLTDARLPGLAIGLAAALGTPALAQSAGAAVEPISTSQATTAAPPANQDAPAQAEPAVDPDADDQRQTWNWHVQNTDIYQAALPFAAKESGPHSLNNKGEAQETVSVDVTAGVRLWPGAELHADGLMWQGFGLSHTFGVVDFPNGEAYKAGTATPNLMFSRLFVRQTIGLGGEQEDVPDDQLTLAGKQDISRLTFTIGRMSFLDVFDHNTYAGDPRTQFMNWALMANLTWDYGQDTVGYGTGATVELNQPNWALRYGFFMMPPYVNAGNVGSGDGCEDQFLVWPARGKCGPFFKSWSMATEFERRYSIGDHPGAIRLLGWLDEANDDTYQAATALLLADGSNANLVAAQAYHYSYGIGLNWEQELTKSIGVFSRLGWNDGKTQALEFSDANWSASLGVRTKGDRWNRPNDTAGLAGVVTGISHDNQLFLAAGGLGIEAGDGALTYGPETAV
jgi:high affinity Mn2+ porin